MFQNIVSLFAVAVVVLLSAGCSQAPVRAVNEPMKQVVVDDIRTLPNGRGVQKIQMLKTVPSACDVVENDQIMDISEVTSVGEKVDMSVTSKTIRLRTLSCPPPVRIAQSSMPAAPSVYFPQTGYGYGGYGVQGGIATPQNPYGSIIPVGNNFGGPMRPPGTW